MTKHGYYAAIIGQNQDALGFYMESDPFHLRSNAEAWMACELQDTDKQGKTARGEIREGEFDIDMDWGDKEG